MWGLGPGSGRIWKRERDKDDPPSEEKTPFCSDTSPSSNGVREAAVASGSGRGTAVSLPAYISTIHLNCSEFVGLRFSPILPQKGCLGAKAVLPPLQYLSNTRPHRHSECHRKAKEGENQGGKERELE